MTLKKPKAAKGLLGSFSQERTKLRSLLRKASGGNVHAFTQAASSYINLISEYLYLCGITDVQDRTTRIQKILEDCWRYLPYTRRVSDFERFLQVHLEHANIQTRFVADAPHSGIATLNHSERFLLVARIFEGWSFKSLKLAFRWSQADISKTLTELKCKLAGFQMHLLKPYEILQVMRVNDLLEGELSDKQVRKIEKELAGQYHAHQFKADWLSYRCELADLKLETTLSESEMKSLVEEISESLKFQPMEQPRLADSLINHFSFVRLPLL